MSSGDELARLRFPRARAAAALAFRGGGGLGLASCEGSGPAAAAALALRLGGLRIAPAGRGLSPPSKSGSGSDLGDSTVGMRVERSCRERNSLLGSGATRVPSSGTWQQQGSWA